MSPCGFVAVRAQIDFSRFLFQFCSHNSYYQHIGGSSRTCGPQMDIQQTLPAQGDCSPLYSYEDNCCSSPRTLSLLVSVHTRIYLLQRAKEKRSVSIYPNFPTNFYFQQFIYAGEFVFSLHQKVLGNVIESG